MPMKSEFPAALAAHLAERIREMRRRYCKRLARCQKKFSEGAVHELRIETRRLLAMLDLLDALGVREALKKTRRIFKRRLDAFDELRDTHVQLSLLKPLCRDFPEAREFNLMLLRREKKLIGELHHDIEAVKQARLERRLKALEKELRKSAKTKPRKAGVSLAAAALSETFARVVLLRRMVRRNNTKTIHQMRVAFKRFRYMSELLQTMLPRLTKKHLRRMQEYQSMMGDIQDMEVLLAGLKEAAAEQCVPAAAMLNLRNELRGRRRRLIGVFMDAIDGLFDFDPDTFARRPREKRKPVPA
jgi:CHAD domain-containing protein